MTTAVLSQGRPVTVPKISSLLPALNSHWSSTPLSFALRSAKSIDLGSISIPVTRSKKGERVMAKRPEPQ